MPRTAALLDATQVSEVVRIIDPKTFEHPIYAGNAVETVRTSDGKVVLTISARRRLKRWSRGAPAGGAGPDADCVGSPGVERRARGGVGRALGSKEEFERLLGPLADSLGAALGASRAAVDAGYAPNDWQVGQTGKIVARTFTLRWGFRGRSSMSLE